ncbi:hypothetical protein Nepgr_029995 [Nepenthes gracilis]|uniref:Glucose-methanol-choline oxidoreductase N-terminal domain-containing protein n=1 Tax=Nepenthes gracilis TaxID=150966 RepID=A0AAD3Y3I9_NEPGR|nr:hypothetical protein Nepgr_029995 [Nepenthes gracilis]
MHYDYIIIGGGTAGCALAATLSEGANVLVLERGGSPYGNENIENKDDFGFNLDDMSPFSPAQQFLSEDGVLNARARVLGGGSAINAGFYSRASSEYVAKAGWDGASVDHSYEWVERKVAFEPPVMQFQSAVKNALLEVGVDPDNGFTFEHMYGTKIGGTSFDRNGRRHTAADLLEYANPKRIAVYLYATVHKVLIDDNGFRRPKVVGVKFRDELGIKHRAFVRLGAMNEVILSAGAIGSPQLLMLSGIGPWKELRLHGIDVVLDQPMVGQGMADNPMNGVLVPSRIPVETSLIQVVGITRFDNFIEAASGSTMASALAMNLLPKTKVFPSQQMQDGNQSPNWSYEQEMPPEMANAYAFINSLVNGSTYGGLVLEKTTGPISKGHLVLKSKDPNDNPSVTFNYFEDPTDLKRCIQGMETVIDVVKSRSLSRFRYPDMTVESLLKTMLDLPLNARRRYPHTGTVSLERFCRDTVMTIWHYHGGCVVGKVVDEDYKVIGVDGLRVVDGSTFDSTPGTNPQATVMMLGRYMGKKILLERYQG